VKITAGLILRNERHRYLEFAIANLLEFVDEIAILDDGSTDGWEELIPKGAPVRILYRSAMDRDERPAFHQHAEARNALLRFTLDGNPDWVIASDADELFSDGTKLRREIERTTADVLNVEICEVWEICSDRLCVREDGGWRSHPIGAVWRVAPFRSQALSLRDRQTATGRVPDAVHGVPAGSSGVALFHLGWTRESERAERFKRYPPGSGHANAHVASIMWPPERVKLEGWAWPRRLPKTALLDRVAK
jgi:hypothetical protein